MQLLFFQQWLPEAVLRALCWTLVHSLWQGLLAATLAGTIILFTRKSSAKLRYNLLGSVLVVFIISSIITLVTQINLSKPNEFLSLKGDKPINTPNSFVETNNLSLVTTATAVERISDWLNTHAGLLFTCWLIIFLFNCLKLLTGIGSVQRLRHYRVQSVPADWEARLKTLAEMIGVRQGVRLLQSALVKVPVTVGMLKPVILVPVGLLVHLPGDQVESILLHELAHIRRRDYFINLLQRLIEAVYFFNPAILWISALIRQEREACCDDIVMANTAGSNSYVNALVAFQEFQMPGNTYAMTIGTKRNYLLNRVRRLLTRENVNLNIMEKIFLTAGLVALMAFTILPKEHATEIPVPASTIKSGDSKNLAETKPAATHTVTLSKLTKKKEPKKIIPIIFQDTTDTTKKKKAVQYESLNFKGVSTDINDDGKTKTENITVTDQSGKKYSVSKVNGEIKSLVVDGKAIPASEFQNHQALLMQIDQMRQAQRESSARSKEVRKAQLLQREAIVRNEAVRRDQAQQKRAQLALLDRQRAELERLRRQHQQQEQHSRDQLHRLQERQQVELRRLNDQHQRTLDRTRQQQEQDLRRQRDRLEKQTELLKKLNNTTQTEPGKYPTDAAYSAYSATTKEKYFAAKAYNAVEYKTTTSRENSAAEYKAAQMDAYKAMEYKTTPNKAYKSLAPLKTAPATPTLLKSTGKPATKPKMII